MVRINKITVLFLFVALLACREEAYENVFDEAPSERRKEFFDKLQSTLSSTEEGWIMQYFPTVKSPGYNLFADFDDAYEVVLGANNQLSANVYAEYKSRYGITVENGPVLSFVTYNELLHPFTDPDIPSATGGDFEFRVIDVTENLIKLIGKRNETEIWLNRLAGNTTGKEYILQSDAMKNFLFSQGTPSLYLETADKTFSLSDGYTSILTIKDLDVDTAAVENIAYVATPTGLRLYKPLEAGDLKLQEFRINADKSALVCPDADARIVAKSHLLDFFFDSFVVTFPNSWKIDKNNLKGIFVEVYTQIVDNCKSKYNEDFDNFFFVYKMSRRMMTLSFKSGKYEGAFDFGIALKEGTTNEIVFTYKGSADTNGNVYLRNIPGFDVLINNLIDGSYKVDEESSLSLTSIKLINVSNPDNGIRLSLN
jgi:hypothetical protein